MADLSNSLPTLMNLSEASRFLGYKSTGPIKKLILEKKLKSYNLPDTDRIMVDRKELALLPKKPSKSIDS